MQEAIHTECIQRTFGDNSRQNERTHQMICCMGEKHTADTHTHTVRRKVFYYFMIDPEEQWREIEESKQQQDVLHSYMLHA